MNRPNPSIPTGASPAPGPDAPPAYRTVSRAAEAELVVRRSRFIGTVWPVSGREEAEARIAAQAARYADATHNVPAYRTGITALVESCSDAGEPAGTAGRPILAVLQKEDLRQVALVVTRYFGGTLLGAGGLVRAYTEAAAAAVRAAGVVEMRLCRRLDAAVPYDLLGKVQHLLLNRGARLDEPEYGAVAHLSAWLPAEPLATIVDEVAEATGGRIRPVAGPFAYLPDATAARQGDASRPRDA